VSIQSRRKKNNQQANSKYLQKPLFKQLVLETHQNAILKEALVKLKASNRITDP